MISLSIIKAMERLKDLIEYVNATQSPILLVNNKGKNSVLISEDEWKNIEETLYLSSIPGL